MNEAECPACGSTNTSLTSLLIKGKHVRRCERCKTDFLRVGDLLQYFDPVNYTPAADEYEYKYGGDF